MLDFVTAVSAAEEEEGERERGRRTTVEALGERQSDSAPRCVDATGSRRRS